MHEDIILLMVSQAYQNGVEKLERIRNRHLLSVSTLTSLSSNSRLTLTEHNDGTFSDKILTAIAIDKDATRVNRWPVQVTQIDPGAVTNTHVQSLL